MDLATASNITSSNILSVTNNHNHNHNRNHNHNHNHNHQRDLSENQFVEKHDSVIETKINPLTYTNGVVLKRHGSNTKNIATAVVLLSDEATAIATKQPVVASSTVYKECLKNHAASLGGHALDGCGEFMPSPNSSLKCAACGCHRNFHRRDSDDPWPLVIQSPTTTTQVTEYQPLHRHHPPTPLTSPSPASFRRLSPSPPPISSSYYPSSAPQMLLALSSGTRVQNPPSSTTPPPVQTPQMMTTTRTPNGRKRFRTKFTSGQKEKMLDFAERVGWKMQKRDHEIVASFCNEIGVDRGVLNVWMHNNKSKSGDNQQQLQRTHVPNNVVANATTNIISNSISDNHALNMNHDIMHNNTNLNGGVIGGIHVNVRDDNGKNHRRDDDEDDSEDDHDDDDISPRHGANGSSSSS